MIDLELLIPNPVSSIAHCSYKAANLWNSFLLPYPFLLPLSFSPPSPFLFLNVWYLGSSSSLSFNKFAESSRQRLLSPPAAPTPAGIAGEADLPHREGSVGTTGSFNDFLKSDFILISAIFVIIVEPLVFIFT